VCLKPTEQFGIGKEIGKTIVKNSEGEVIYDANTGKFWFKSDVFLTLLMYQLNGQI